MNCRKNWTELGQYTTYVLNNNFFIFCRLLKWNKSKTFFNTYFCDIHIYRMKQNSSSSGNCNDVPYN